MSAAIDLFAEPSSGVLSLPEPPSSSNVEFTISPPRQDNSEWFTSLQPSRSWTKIQHLSSFHRCPGTTTVIQSRLATTFEVLTDTVVYYCLVGPKADTVVRPAASHWNWIEEPFRLFWSSKPPSHFSGSIFPAGGESETLECRPQNDPKTLLGVVDQERENLYAQIEALLLQDESDGREQKISQLMHELQEKTAEWSDAFEKAFENELKLDPAEADEALREAARLLGNEDPSE